MQKLVTRPKWKDKSKRKIQVILVGFHSWLYVFVYLFFVVVFLIIIKKMPKFSKYATKAFCSNHRVDFAMGVKLS